MDALSTYCRAQLPTLVVHQARRTLAFDRAWPSPIRGAGGWSVRLRPALFSFFFFFFWWFFIWSPSLSSFLSFSQARADGTFRPLRSTSPSPSARRSARCLPGQGRFRPPRADRGLDSGTPRPVLAPTARSDTVAAACRATEGPSRGRARRTRRDSRSRRFRSTSRRARARRVPADLRERTCTAWPGPASWAGRPCRSAPGAGDSVRSPWDLALRAASCTSRWPVRTRSPSSPWTKAPSSPVAGNGREALVDGLGPRRRWPSPRGSPCRHVLYRGGQLIDGGAPSICARRVYTLAGGPGLFDFGDKVGRSRRGCCSIRSPSRHPASGLIVADTYNDKLKQFSPDGSG